MLGAIVAVVVLVVAIPVGVLLSGALVASVASWSLTTDAADRHTGSELVELNR